MLGERIERNLNDLLEILIRAKYTKQPQELLEQANLVLKVLRFKEADATASITLMWPSGTSFSVNPRSLLMKRRLFIIAGYLVAIAVGVAIGYFAGRNNLLAGRLSETSSDLKAGEAGPDWKEWKYPGCAEHGSSLGGGGQAGMSKVPPLYCLVMTTPDDYEKVLKYYADKMGNSVLAVGAGSGTKVDSSNPENCENWFVLNDALSPEGANRSRPVKAKVFGKRTPTYDLTMHVSRANDENHTHIMLAYYPAK